MNIGENIKKFREKGGLSQRHLGNLANISGQYISLMEKPGSQMFKSIETLESIAKALNVTVPELLGYPIAELDITEVDIETFSTDDLLKELFRRIKK